VALNLTHRIDTDLAYWLDHAVEHAIKRGDVRVVDDRGEPARIVDITSDLDAPTYAIVKRNIHIHGNGGGGGFGESVVTIYDQRRIDENEASGRWKSLKGTMAEKLAGVTIGPRTDLKPANGSAPVVVEEPPAEEPVEVALDPDELVLVEYHDAEGTANFLKLKRSELAGQLMQLALRGVDTSKLRFWRQVAAQAKLDIKIEGI